MKKWLQRASLMGASLMIALLVAEIAVRLLIYVPRGTPYVAEDPDTIYNNKPNIAGSHHSPGEFSYSFKTSSRGFRSGELRAANETMPRILCLGDSFTFGIGADDSNTWPAQLEAKLNASGKKTEVVNAGVMGWGLAEYWVWTSLHAAELKPRLMIVACHAGDWENAAYGLVSLDSKGTLERHRVIRQDVSRLKGIAEHIPLYDTLMAHSAIANLIKQSVIRVTNSGTTGGISNNPFDGAIDRTGYETDQFEKLSNINQALLRGLQQTAGDIQAGLLIVFIPSYGEMTPGGDSGAGHRLFRERLQTWTNKTGIPFVDTTPFLKGHLDKHSLPVSDLYYPRNEHCTDLGYQIIAQAVSDMISGHPEWLAGSSNRQASVRR